MSTRGGRHPLWSRNGKELYYRDFAGAVVAVPVPAGPRFLPGEPMTVVPANSSYTGGGAALSARSYDLSLAGGRFLMVKVDEVNPRSMFVVQNWTEELKRLVSGRSVARSERRIRPNFKPGRPGTTSCEGSDPGPT